MGRRSGTHGASNAGGTSAHGAESAGHELDIDQVVLIVVGAHPKAELCDRPVAYALRKRIEDWFAKRFDQAAEEKHPARALVVTDVWYLNDPSLRQCPTIAIGGPGVNALSAYLGDKVPSAYVVDGVLMVQLDLELTELVACCWGSRAESTAAAVEAFWTRYAEDFLKAAGRRMG